MYSKWYGLYIKLLKVNIIKNATSRPVLSYWESSGALWNRTTDLHIKDLSPYDQVT